MLNIGDRVRVRRFREIPYHLMPEKAVTLNMDGTEPDWIYGLEEREIEEDCARGDAEIIEVRTGFDDVGRDYRIRFTADGRESEWYYVEEMLEPLEEDDNPILSPETDILSFLFA